MTKRLSLAISIIIITGLFFPYAVSATPRLGVATDSGIYAYTDPDMIDDEWLKYFADDIIPAIGEFEGFKVGPSGSFITVFTSYDVLTTPVYLLASPGAELMPTTFGGVPFTLDDYSFITGQTGGYTGRPYAYLQLVDTGTYSWKPAPSDFLKEGDKTFWFYTAPITYTGEWVDGYYFFAAAETDGTPGLQFNGSDAFSPKTTSAGGHETPEPATMLLFGLGTLGFGIARRRKR